LQALLHIWEESGPDTFTVRNLKVSCSLASQLIGVPLLGSFPFSCCLPPRPYLYFLSSPASFLSLLARYMQPLSKSLPAYMSQQQFISTRCMRYLPVVRFFSKSPGYSSVCAISILSVCAQAFRFIPGVLSTRTLSFPVLTVYSTHV
jgi:hypothetical protein